MKTSADNLTTHGKPLRPRDNHVKQYEAYGILSPSQAHFEPETIAPYHCGFEGCSERFHPAEGYFTVVNVLEQSHFVEEPGTNLLQCPGMGPGSTDARMKVPQEIVFFGVVE